MNPDSYDSTYHSIRHMVERAGMSDREWYEGRASSETNERLVSALKHFADKPPQALGKYPTRWKEWVFTLVTNGMMMHEGSHVAVTVKGYNYLKTLEEN